MFKTSTKDQDYIKLEKIAELNPTDSVSYLVNSVRGELKEAEKGDQIIQTDHLTIFSS